MSDSDVPSQYDLPDKKADAVVVTTLEGRVIEWNAAAELLFGYTSAEAVGDSVFNLIVPLDQAEGERQLLDETAEDDDSSYECVYRRKDGSMLYVANSSKVLIDPRTKSKLIKSSMSDITEFTLGLDMNQVRDKFGALLESMPDAIIMTNLTGRIVLANSLAEKLFGYQRGELPGQLVEILMPERFRLAHAGLRNIYFAKPRIRSIGSGLDLYGLRKDGTEFQVEISLSPLQPKNSSVVVSAIREVSNRKKGGG